VGAVAVTSPLAETEPPTRRERMRNRLAGARRRLGRVRGASVASGAVALLAALLVGRLVLGLGATVQTLLAGILLGSAVYTLASERPPVQVLGAGLLVPGGLLVVASTGLPASLMLDSFGAAMAALATVTAVGTVGFVAVLSGSNVPEDGELSAANSRAASALVGPVVLLGLLVLPDLGLARAVITIVTGVFGAVVGHLLAEPPDLAPFVFPLLLLATALLVRRALRSVPVDTLVAAERREAVVTRLASVERGATLTALLGFGLLVALPLLAAGGGIPDLTGLRAGLPAALAGPVLALVAAPLLRLLLLGVAAVSFLAMTGYRVARLVSRASPQSLARRLAPPLGGLLAAAVVTGLLTVSGGAATLRDELLGAVGAGLAGPLSAFDPVALGVVVAGFGLFASASALRSLGGVVLLVGATRAVGPTLAGLVTFVLAAVALLVGAGALAFVVAALAIVAWDLGEYGRGLGEELVAGARTTRAEVTHAAGSLGVGAVAVGTALGVGSLLSGAAAVPGAAALVALTLATVAAVVLLYSL
jgi:hypothetical protein